MKRPNRRNYSQDNLKDIVKRFDKLALKGTQRMLDERSVGQSRPLLIIFVIGAPTSGKTTYLHTVKNSQTLCIDDPVDFLTDVLVPIQTSHTSIVYIADHTLMSIEACMLAIQKLQNSLNCTITFEYVILNKSLQELYENIDTRNLTEPRNISKNYIAFCLVKIAVFIKYFNLYSIPYTEPYYIIP